MNEIFITSNFHLYPRKEFRHLGLMKTVPKLHVHYINSDAKQDNFISVRNKNFSPNTRYMVLIFNRYLARSVPYY